ncbi:MAG: vWA domain-containing protein [Luteolibacter sp.]
MKTLHTFLAATALLFTPAFATEAPTDPKPAQSKVQIALLLDTSNSMDGLIDQARTQLWKVVNTFTEAKRDGQTPYVEVALYEYGNSGLSVANNYIRQVQPLTRDLDELSKQLFALKTNGGEEYCGAVIQRALGDLAWDPSGQTYKAIFIAGNEPFTQGSVDARQACKDAIGKGVVVNTIHCGSRQEGINGSWHDGAALAEGKYLVIDQDRAVVHIDAPQDKQIADLGIQLNKTYLGYGSKRADGYAKQAYADESAITSSAPAAKVERAVAKASKNYSNTSWDLVDAVKEKKVDPAKLKEDELPEAMRSLKPEERAAFIQKTETERASIQKQITDLSRQRDAFIAEARKKQAKSDTKTLDEVLVETTRDQAAKKGYTFKN